MKRLLFLWTFIEVRCSPAPKLTLQESTSYNKAGSALFKEWIAYDWKKRDSMIIAEITKGNMPSFIQQMSPVYLQLYDTASQKTIKATISITPEYMSVVTNIDWVRFCLTPMAA